MVDKRFVQFCSLIDFPIFIGKCSNVRDPSLNWFVWVLNVPIDILVQTEDRIMDIALQIYGEDTLPFVIGVLTPERTAELKLN